MKNLLKFITLFALAFTVTFCSDDDEQTTKDLALNITLKEFYEFSKIDLHIFTFELNKFETLIEENRSSYEEVLDKTTKSIEKFIENAEIDQEKNIQ